MRLDCGCGLLKKNFYSAAQLSKLLASADLVSAVELAILKFAVPVVDGCCILRLAY